MTYQETKSNVFGEFSEDGKEFIIREPLTPSPWMNIIGNSRYGSYISQNGGGYSFFLDPLRNRITRWHVDSIPHDAPGKYLFIKDEETGTSWTVNGLPGSKPYDHWEARHGQGYTKISATLGEIESDITYFVPLEHDVEIWKVKIRNKGDRKRQLSLYSFVELALGNACDDILVRDFFNLFNEVIYSNGIIWATKNQWTKRDGLFPGKNPGNLVWSSIAFFTSTLPAESFECLRENFIGAYRSLFAPEGLEREKLSNTTALGEDAVAVLHHRITLEPGEEVKFHNLLGVHPRNEDAKPLIQELLDPEKIETELDHVHQYWDALLSTITVKTPDPVLDRLFNRWLKYQCMAQLRFAESISFHESTVSELSVRNLCQQLLTCIVVSPDLCRQLLLEIAHYQYFDGDFSHGILPLVEKGTKTGHSDHKLWLPYLVSHYCRETGDFELLNKRIPYHDRGEATLYDHCLRAIYFVLERKSARGLPLIYKGDWNESLDQAGREGKGDSVWLGMFLVHIMKRFLFIAGERQDATTKARLTMEIERIANVINQQCWDGSWYHRALQDDDVVIGGSNCEAGKIFLLPQAWAIISGIAPREKGLSALNAISEHLDTEMGTRCMFPSYEKPDQGIGLTTRFAPGKRENGGIIKVAHIWRLIAECIYGNGDLAYETWKKGLNYQCSLDDPENFRAEPYAESACIDGPDSQSFGKGSGSWSSCSASWTFRLIHDWILGIRLERRGMKIDPCIPSEWEELSVTKIIRGVTYRVEIRNPQKISKGVKSIHIDDVESQSSLIPYFEDGKTHEIKILMGKEVPPEVAAAKEAPEQRSAEPDTAEKKKKPGTVKVPDTETKDGGEKPTEAEEAEAVPEPEKPETPEAPAEPEKPETPEAPAEPEKPGTPEAPAEPEKQETPEDAEKTEAAEPALASEMNQTQESEATMPGKPEESTEGSAQEKEES